MEIAEYKARMARREYLTAGSGAHLLMHRAAEDARRIACEINGAFHTAEELRALFSQLIGQELDDGFALFPPVYTDFGKNITLGERVFINAGCCFQDQGGIFIGDDCRIGHQVVFATLNHDLAPARRKNMFPAPIHIGKNVWIGAHATILAGVTVGDNAVAGGDSAALGDYPANAWTYMGGVIGTLAQQSASDKFTIEGVLYDFYYDGMYAWVTPSSSTGGDRLTKKFWRGLLLGVRSPGVNVSYSNIYITDNTFAMCAGTADNIGAAGTVRVNSWETTAYSAIYAFDGTSSNGIIDADTNNDANTSFIYVESKTVSAINFSQDDNYMIEISRQTGVDCVMCDVSINR